MVHLLSYSTVFYFWLESHDSMVKHLCLLDLQMLNAYF